MYDLMANVMGRPLVEEMATHSSILAWKIPWTEEPGGLQFIRLQRVQHHLPTEHTYMHNMGQSEENEELNTDNQVF